MESILHFKWWKWCVGGSNGGVHLVPGRSLEGEDFLLRSPLLELQKSEILSCLESRAHKVRVLTSPTEVALRQGHRHLCRHITNPIQRKSKGLSSSFVGGTSPATLCSAFCFTK